MGLVLDKKEKPTFASLLLIKLSLNLNMVHSSNLPWTLQHCAEILANIKDFELSNKDISNLENSTDYLDKRLLNSDDALYGINTGFGSLYKVKISPSETKALQENLLMSHACGTGDMVPIEIVRWMLLLKIKSLTAGYSGVRKETVERLLFFLKNDLIPVVYQLGSLGASGDLAPLAHMCLPLIGMGEVHFQGEIKPANEVLAHFGLSPIKLREKEGLGLLNGTQFSAGYLSWCLLEAQKISAWSDAISSMSIEAFNGNASPYDERIHAIRPHPGQVFSASRIRKWLAGSAMINSEGKETQDPYAFRCAPQVHGASLDSINFVKGVLEIELNSVTDNPLIFPDSDAILSGGNFHAQPLALPGDLLAIALAELGNISERRTYQLISGQRGLPAFLVKKGGLNSGLMIPQYTAAGIVSQNKQLCTPASIDSIVSSNGQEDHVSMASNVATKCHRVVQNLWRILAIEMMTAAQALDFRGHDKTSPQLLALHQAYREKVEFLEEDRPLYLDMHKTELFLRSFRLES
jgi:histidine ammonia-lyase